jgi:hypothetical protein
LIYPPTNVVKSPFKNHNRPKDYSWFHDGCSLALSLKPSRVMTSSGYQPAPFCFSFLFLS